MRSVSNRGEQAHSGEIAARYREVWLPVAVFLVVRALGLAVLARFAQLRHQNLPDLLDAWDGKWMIGLATFGYDHMPWRFVDARGIHTSDTAYAFFPGYPILVHYVALAPGLNAFRAGLLVNIVLGAAAAVAAYRLGRLCAHAMPQVPDHYADRVGLLTTVLFVAAPMGIVMSMVYTEALYCALAGWALVGLLERRWLLAGGCTLVAGLCRPTAVVLIGVVMLAALLTVFASERLLAGRNVGPAPAPEAGARVRAAVCLLLAPVGWLTWLLVVARHTGMLTGWFQVQTDGWGTTFDLGKQTFQFVNYTLINGSDIADLSTVGLLGLSVVLMVVTWRSGMPWQVMLYGSLVLISLLGSGGLMISRPRLLLPAFVLLIPIAVALARRSRAAQAWTCAAVVVITCWYGAHMVSVYPHAI
ncbi:hypothetical protein [Tsukamurella soli]|uniref:Glycosyltransferase family 39 protein n=1 Tax=Tsukamurella soli TaxID=644556 RepID=A0ABP8J7X4_9ACTN